jgi:hypothetical protein
VLRRGAGNISGYADVAPYGIDITGLADWALALAGQLDHPTAEAGPPTAPILCDR